MRAPLHWLDGQLSDGRKFLLGNEPAAIDAQFYHLVWFLRGRWQLGPSFLAEFPHLERWETNVTEIGHGKVTALSPDEAILHAANCEPLDKQHDDACDPQGVITGMPVVVSPDLDGGEQPVEGKLIAADSERVVIRRTEPGVGNINVHFPRFGYRIEPSN